MKCIILCGWLLKCCYESVLLKRKILHRLNALSGSWEKKYHSLKLKVSFQVFHHPISLPQECWLQYIFSLLWRLFWPFCFLFVCLRCSYFLVLLLFFPFSIGYINVHVIWPNYFNYNGHNENNVATFKIINSY